MANKMALTGLRQRLQEEKFASARIFTDEPMSKHTSFRIGGPADLLVIPGTVEEVREILVAAKAEKVPLTVIGNGSNILVRDGGIRGLVLQLGNGLKDFLLEGNIIKAGAGLPLALVAQKARNAGLTGLEFAAGIPGSLGGAVYMNAGAYDGEMSKVVESVTVLDTAGNVQMLGNAELDFSYRHSALQQKSLLVTEVTLRLEKGNVADIEAKMADFTARRIVKQPLELPSAGSTFKRPPGNFAGTLIEQAGLKGYSVGGAQVSPKHAGFVVNIGGAKARDVLQLIADVQKTVQEKFGVRLEPEVLVLGED